MTQSLKERPTYFLLKVHNKSWEKCVEGHKGGVGEENEDKYHNFYIYTYEILKNIEKLKILKQQ